MGGGRGETWEKGLGPSSPGGASALLHPHSTVERLQMGFGLLTILSTTVWRYQCKHSGCLERHCGGTDGTGDQDSRPGFSFILTPWLSGCPQTGHFLALTLIFFICKTKGLGIHELLKLSMMGRRILPLFTSAFHQIVQTRRHTDQTAAHPHGDT